MCYNKMLFIYKAVSVGSALLGGDTDIYFVEM